MIYSMALKTRRTESVWETPLHYLRALYAKSCGRHFRSFAIKIYGDFL